MSIIMANVNPVPGARIHVKKQGDREMTFYMVESHKGLVHSTYERNGYDDSDFYARVWNREKQAFDEVMYATTRGWTYLNSATPDITDPEILAEIEAANAKALEDRRARQARRDRLTPRVNNMVRVTKSKTRGKNVAPVGSEGRIFWVGTDRYSTYNSRYFSYEKSLLASMAMNDPREGLTIGIQINDGRKVFISAMDAEPIE